MTTYNDLLRALERFSAASGIPAAIQHGSAAPGSLDLSRSPQGWRIIEHVGESGERDVSPRMSAAELERALDLAADLFRMTATNR